LYTKVTAFIWACDVSRLIKTHAFLGSKLALNV